MKDWKQDIEQRLHKQKNSVAKINIDKATVQYSETIKQNRNSAALPRVLIESVWKAITYKDDCRPCQELVIKLANKQ